MTCAGYAEFLEHLETCDGCTGEKRTFRRCDYALHCATVEVLAKKGVVRNSEELMLLGSDYPNSSDSVSLIDERATPRASLYGIGSGSSD